MTHYADVAAFHAKMAIPKAEHLPGERLRHLSEEMLELGQAWERGDRPAVVDALVDLIYVALGNAIILGLTEAQWDACWEAVQAANMRKERDPTTAKGVRKPPGWAAPNIALALAFTKDKAVRRLWVDDAKPAPDDDYALARTYEDALRLLRRFEYDELYLDHDLGPGPTGLALLRQIRAEGRCPPRVICISWNPAGRRNIEAELDQPPEKP